MQVAQYARPTLTTPHPVQFGCTARMFSRWPGDAIHCLAIVRASADLDSPVSVRISTFSRIERAPSARISDLISWWYSLPLAAMASLCFRQLALICADDCCGGSPAAARSPLMALMSAASRGLPSRPNFGLGASRGFPDCITPHTASGTVVEKASRVLTAPRLRWHRGEPDEVDHTKWVHPDTRPHADEHEAAEVVT